MNYNRVLSIAGSDSGGGAGIQADIKSISANGAFAMTAITAVTSQNTLGVQHVFPLPVDVVQSQIDSVLNDIGADAIKIGMLHSAGIIHAVVRMLKQYAVNNIVLDPVMVATSGDSLFQSEALSALKEHLIPISTLVTPNIPEAETLSGQKITSIDDMRRIAVELSLQGKVSVLIKGGHLQKTNELCDVLYDATTGKTEEFYSSKIDTVNKHGTGCTLSSAIAAWLAQGYTVVDAVRKAKDYIDGAIAAGSEYNIGSGHGPVHHFYQQNHLK